MRRYYYDDHKPYVTFFRKGQLARASIAALTESGRTLNPVKVSDEAIAHTWWAKAWNKNLESYADYKSRIARGRLYLKNDTIIDLVIEKGDVRALVQGSASKPYEVTIKIAPLSEDRWLQLLKVCQHQISSLRDLVEGCFPQGLEKLFKVKGEGLFPSNTEIDFQCTCLDNAVLCKHIAAALYGIGARFDQDPLLFFKLRGIDFKELLSTSIEERVQQMLKKSTVLSHRAINDEDVEALFHLEGEEI